MNRKVSPNPSQAEIRLHCLDMAVRGAQLTGRTESIMGIAEQYLEWVTKGAHPTAPQPPAASSGGDDDEGDEGVFGGAGNDQWPAGSIPPSLRPPAKGDDSKT